MVLVGPSGSGKSTVEHHRDARHAPDSPGGVPAGKHVDDEL
jgi:ABC-type lipoprotein export system ATPase subunit